MDTYPSLDLSNLNYSWDEDRKFILRGWSFVFSILAALMLLSLMDGRMAYLQGSYTGYLGIWIDCTKHQCAKLGQVTVLIHMSMGFMMLALMLCVIFLPTMGLSFRPVFHRLNKIDFVFSLLSFTIALLIILSVTLFVVHCEALKPRPQVTYLMTTYLCWGSGAVMLWTGFLNLLNHMGMWSDGSTSLDRRVSYRRWSTRQNSMKQSSRSSDTDPKSILAQSNPPPPQGTSL